MERIPETANVLLTCADGSVMIMAVVGNDFRGIEREVTDAVIQAEIDKNSVMWAASIPEKLPLAGWARLAAGGVPTDRAFRGAWVEKAGRVEVDMPRAREIHRDRLRALRAPLLTALDTDYMRADEAGDTAAKVRIAAQKQALRDVTADPAIEAAKTPEALAAVLPAALRGAV